MVVFDTGMLVLLLAPEASPPNDPATGAPLVRLRDRLDHLVARLEASRAKILVPTPVLCELLIGAGQAGAGYLEIIKRSARFRVVDFDQRAAVETAAAVRDAIAVLGEAPGTALTAARQVVAIAKVEGASAIHSDDPTVRRLAGRAGVAVIASHELEVPPEHPQAALPFG